MATITPAVVFPVGGGQATSTAQSGTFIPAVWSSKLAAKFYTASVVADITNKDWEGEISGQGDKVIINQIPTLTISNYTAGAGISYESPTPSTIELLIDKGKSFAFRLNDVMSYQSQPNLLDMFSNDAAQQMKIAVDSNVIYNTFDNCASTNKGATAGKKSASIALGTSGTPIDTASVTALEIVLRLSSTLDEANVPDSDRFLLIDPWFRQKLLNGNLAQAYITGDATSPVRNGKIGMIDRFNVYVTNNLPTAAANATVYTSGDGSETSLSCTTNASARHLIIAGHKSAISFASQITKTETVRDPYDFGDYVRGLQVYGFKNTQTDALAYAVAK